MTAVIAGVAEFPYGTTEFASTMALHEALAEAALADAGASPDQVGAILSVNPRSDSYLVHAEAVAERLGLQPEVANSVEAGGTAPIVMIATAAALIESGTVDVAVVIAADLPKTNSTHSYLETLTQVGPIHPEFESSFGATPRSLYGLMATAYLAEYGLDARTLGAVAVHCRSMAAGHPHAQFRTPMTESDYLSSPLVCDPLRRFDCAPVSDGGGAIVLTREGLVAGRHPEIAIDAVAGATSTAHVSLSASLSAGDAGVAGRRALERAGVGLDAVDVALIYDCFSIAMVMNVESLGFSLPGRAAADFAAGAFGGSGRTVVNPHGGLLSHGYPARAAGIANVVEAVLQLRGAAGARQVPGCRTALVHGMSGAQSAHAVAVLSRVR